MNKINKVIIVRFNITEYNRSHCNIVREGCGHDLMVTSTGGLQMHGLWIQYVAFERKSHWFLLSWLEKIFVWDNNYQMLKLYVEETVKVNVKVTSFGRAAFSYSTFSHPLTF